MAIYEVHLGSWQRVPEEGHRWLSYREIAPRLADHVHAARLQRTSSCSRSWSTRSTAPGAIRSAGYYAPTARWGTPDDLRFLVDHLHQRGIGVILDWVPAHFPKDDWALRRFDGDALYEHDDPRRGEHPDWGTLDLRLRPRRGAQLPDRERALLARGVPRRRPARRCRRVDALPRLLAREDRLAAERATAAARTSRRSSSCAGSTRVVARKHPGAFTIAEESTDWPGVTRPAHEGGLGFTFKWNMGWMHDTLRFFARDPSHRRWHHDELTFAMLYEYDERFVNPLSHDEVVHEKRSLLAKLPGDEWQKLANLRLLLAYQWTRPGKILDFMGTELAPPTEWNHDRSLDWHLAGEPPRAGLMRFMAALGRAYHAEPCALALGPRPRGLPLDRLRGPRAIGRLVPARGRRRARARRAEPDAGAARRLPDRRADAARATACCSRATRPSSAGAAYAVEPSFAPDAVPWHGFAQSLRLRLPPLAALVLVPEA